MKRTIPDLDMSVFANFFQPSKPILCSTKNADGSDHIAPFSWFNPVSYKPPMIALSLSCIPRKQHSLLNIERTKEFVVNILQSAHADKLLSAALEANGENKFDRSGFTREKCSVVDVHAVEQSCAFLECRVREIREFGDTATVFADIVAASYDGEIFLPPKMLVNLQNYDPIFHMDSYDYADYQLHVLMSLGKEYVVDVPYPTKEDAEALPGKNFGLKNFD